MCCIAVLFLYACKLALLKEVTLISKEILYAKDQAVSFAFKTHLR